MAAERLAMRKIREVLRLRFLAGLKSSRAIAGGVGCSKTSVNEYLAIASKMGIECWSQIEDLSESELEVLFFPESKSEAIASANLEKTSDQTRSRRPAADWLKVHEELRTRGVTLALLWSEYKEQHPKDGLQYSQFCDRYRQWRQKLSLVMRQVHRPGEKAFVDFSGEGIYLTHPETGEKTRMELFVAALGASSYTFACAVSSQSLRDWIECHRRFLEFLGGVPAILVPDNLKSGIHSPNRYEPEVNPTYQEMAEHYGTCIIPARVRKPRDKSKVENAVLQAQRWILAVLRHRTFYSPQEINQAIRECLHKLNHKKMRGYQKSRTELFELLDHPALKKLPATPFEYAEWKKVRLGIDYHIRYDDHFYSAPYELAREELWCRTTGHTVEIFYKGKRVISHPRSLVKWGKTTRPEHMPSHHRAYAEWTPERLLSWGSTIGPATAKLIESMLALKAHPEQAYQAALGVISLAKKFTPERVERASQKALQIQSPYYRTLKTMLKNRMEETENYAPKATSSVSSTEEQLSLLAQENVRGQSYYH
jgi:transposase